MSTTTGTPLPVPTQQSTIVEIEAWLAARKAEVQHGAQMLLSILDMAKRDITTAEQDPTVKAAVTAATTMALAKGAELGLPETQIETLGKDIVATAHAIADPGGKPPAVAAVDVTPAAGGFTPTPAG